MKSKFTGLILIVLLAGCEAGATPSTSTPASEMIAPDTATGTPASIPATAPPDTQSTPTSKAAPTSLGPDEFPRGYNPLTGQPAADPSLLDIPALIVSISHFPPVARPQAGFSFAPFVYEFFITEGATRHLAVFHGEFPEPEIPIRGDCEVRSAPVADKGILLGNRAWHDEDQNGLQDPSEGGIGGICVRLLDEAGETLQATTTDSNGYYAFSVKTGRYAVEFARPPWLEFTRRNAGDENRDSDPDPVTGRTETLNIPADYRLLDAGLVPAAGATPTPDPEFPLPLPQVGPVRSGRLHYAHIGNYYQESCLIYASASPEVLVQIPGCATVPHTDAGGGAMLEISRMKKIAEQHSANNRDFNYASNLYAEEPPPGGETVLELHEVWAHLNRSSWTYDAASQGWWRYVDESNPLTAGILHPEVDRLNGRQLVFENVVLLFAEHIVIEPTIVDIDLRVGQMGKGYLFRDGRVYEIRWSTRAGEYEASTGLRRPIQFQNLDGSPAALRPGQTWVILYSLQSYLEKMPFGVWRARFIAPAGAK